MNPLARLAGIAVDRAMGLKGTGAQFVVRHNVAVPMPDGVVLLADHYRPARELGPLPVVLIRSPYGRAGLAGSVFAAPLARRGFQVFIQSARGTFGSGGQFRPFLHERADGLATVAWLREQPWCDGRVAMTGGSYLGHTQWAIAPYVDPPLASVSLNITAARITAAFYEHERLACATHWTGADRSAGRNAARCRHWCRIRCICRNEARRCGSCRCRLPTWPWRARRSRSGETSWTTLRLATTSGPDADHDAPT